MIQCQFPHLCQRALRTVRVWALPAGPAWGGGGWGHEKHPRTSRKALIQMSPASPPISYHQVPSLPRARPGAPRAFISDPVWRTQEYSKAPVLSPRGGQARGRQGLVQRLRRRVSHYLRTVLQWEPPPELRLLTGTSGPLLLPSAKGYRSGEIKPGSTGFKTSAPTTNMVFSPLNFN